MKYLNALLTFFMFLPLGLADHNEPIGTSGYLLDQTAGLNSEVQNSTLNYNVKSSVS
ncbi:MAG: hypothetical protein HY072_06840, partial [Deltaproteobacteria bacterium]|nr:hypothetical protein [Deltaproteobacteria bacterium]